ncbi:MAG: ABC transporter substrate-binding protein [Armatimonadetes bacterium]|nr:ABC transporter substrate-binding protein [Armatimonadota bacterium]
MNRRLFVQLLLALLAVLASGCAPAGPQRVAAAPRAASPLAGFPLTVTDDSRRRVTLPAPARRIISLSPAHTETLYALGVGDRLIAADTYSDYPPGARAKAILNCWPRPPAEQIAALKPDLLVVLTPNDEFIRQMEAVQVTVLELFPKTYEQALEGILLLGRVTESEAAARRLVEAMRARARAVQERLQRARRKRVLYEIDASDASRPYVAGGGGLYGDLLRLAGGENIFADLSSPATQVSGEQVVARDPEVILLGDVQMPSYPQRPTMLRARPGWAGITAVRAGKVFAVNGERIVHPGPRLIEGLEEIARCLHPERFPRGSHGSG